MNRETTPPIEFVVATRAAFQSVVQKAMRQLFTGAAIEYTKQVHPRADAGYVLGYAEGLAQEQWPQVWACLVKNHKPHEHMADLSCNFLRQVALRIED